MRKDICLSLPSSEERRRLAGRWTSRILRGHLNGTAEQSPEEKVSFLLSWLNKGTRDWLEVGGVHDNDQAVPGSLSNYYLPLYPSYSPEGLKTVGYFCFVRSKRHLNLLKAKHWGIPTRNSNT